MSDSSGIIILVVAAMAGFGLGLVIGQRPKTLEPINVNSTEELTLAVCLSEHERILLEHAWQEHGYYGPKRPAAGDTLTGKIH